MLSYDGFRLIKIAGGSTDGYVVENGIVEYEPDIKYRIEKKNAFDPTIIIRREPYHEDTITCTAILNPEEYNILVSHITNVEQLFIEFDLANTTMQFPILVDKLPKLDDDSRSFKGELKITFTSIYQELVPINFDAVFGWGTSWDESWGF